MNGLIADMVQEDPTKRPTMDVVVVHFSEIKKHGSHALGWPAKGNFGPLKCGEQWDIGTEPSATSLAVSQRSSTQHDCLVPLATSLLFPISRPHSYLYKFSLYLVLCYLFV